jgi:hypothetical protein
MKFFARTEEGVSQELELTAKQGKHLRRAVDKSGLEGAYQREWIRLTEMQQIETRIARDLHLIDYDAEGKLIVLDEAAYLPLTGR